MKHRITIFLAVVGVVLAGCWSEAERAFLVCANACGRKGARLVTPDRCECGPPIAGDAGAEVPR